MDISRLWDILERERRTASLQELPENFREEVRSYIKMLDEAIKSADDSRKKEILMDERRNAQMKIEDIVRRRMGKIVKFASSGSKIAPKGMLDEEREAYDVIRRQVEESIRKILASMLETTEKAGEMHEETHEKMQEKEKEEDERDEELRENESEKRSSAFAEEGHRMICEANETDDSVGRDDVRRERDAMMTMCFADGTNAVEEEVGAANMSVCFSDADSERREERGDEVDDKVSEEERVEGGKNLIQNADGNDESESNACEERGEDESHLDEKFGGKMDIVRILREIPAFVGIDGRTYKLYREDIVMLPEVNADILCRKGYAMKVQCRRSVK